MLITKDDLMVFMKAFSVLRTIAKAQDANTDQRVLMTEGVVQSMEVLLELRADVDASVDACIQDALKNKAEGA